ncbi:MAG TPA: aminoglycoside phosphotransferase family protein [Thermomicrobiales bacterium]|jgi:aminoglycoside phosphotransferase (APT) family kinase protein|nr:aminoglycoside phosphotransferase family protein [Thermomicrobiales bacterium]
MSDRKLQAGKLLVDVPLVRRLIDTQFPQWSELPIRPVAHDGWDNWTFHLGDDMTVRLPSAAGYAEQVEKEQHWLPRLAPVLPLPIPVPLAMGMPDAEYPWHWSVYEWLDGEVATIERIADLPRFASTLADFLVALQQADATGGPPPGQHNFWRGGPLTVYDDETRQALKTLEGAIDIDAARAVWETALAATWHGSPVWFHGDVAFGNLLVKNGELYGVIDFGTSGVGDPSCDLAIAWTLFAGESREVFRAALPLDEGTWARGRGWTLWKALITLAPIADTDSLEARTAWNVIDEVLADHELTRERSGPGLEVRV